MSGTYAIEVGNKGRVVIPAPLRKHKGWEEGTTLIAVETDLGAVLASRSQIESILRQQLRGADVVGELLEERRAASLREDAQ